MNSNDNQGLLADLGLNMGNDVFARMLSERLREEVSAKKDPVDVMTSYKAEFDALWLDPAFRLRRSPPKQVIAEINKRLQASGGKAVSISSLARAHRLKEVPDEVLEVLTPVDAAVRP